MSPHYNNGTGAQRIAQATANGQKWIVNLSRRATNDLDAFKTKN